MKATAGRLGELVSLLDAADFAARQHECFARFFVGDGVDAADLRTLLVGCDEVFLVLGFHVYRSVSGAGIFSQSAPTWVLYISGVGVGVYGAWSGGKLRLNYNRLGSRSFKITNESSCLGRCPLIC